MLATILRLHRIKPAIQKCGDIDQARHHLTSVMQDPALAQVVKLGRAGDASLVLEEWQGEVTSEKGKL